MDDAFLGGEDDGAKIYIGRAHFNGDLVPANVIPDRRAIYVPFACQAKKVHRCEVRWT
jgi:Protein of unknown function (DUF3421)